jgi:DNA polymerase-3 subunit epsilon
MPAASVAIQGRLDDLGTPLLDVEFVVLDLETTGGSPANDRITEVGAVKIRGGEVLGTFHTLVDPEVSIPPLISALTGITNGMVADAEPIEVVLPCLLEFLGGAVLVAHNASFDRRFVQANLERHGYQRLANRVVCTARLARKLLPRDEVPNVRLATLAAYLGSTVAPCHRALTDARATVDVFHSLLERAGSYGVLALEDLIEFPSAKAGASFKKVHLADRLPRCPGVYLFRDAAGRVLYVGKAKDLRTRVRSYFSGDGRVKIADLLRELAAIDHQPCATELEASVREVRLIQHYRPRYNRRSRNPERYCYLKLTRERFPRLSVVRRVQPDGARYLGPFGSAGQAELVKAAIAAPCGSGHAAAGRPVPCWSWGAASGRAPARLARKATPPWWPPWRRPWTATRSRCWARCGGAWPATRPSSATSRRRAPGTGWRRSPAPWPRHAGRPPWPGRRRSSWPAPTVTGGR